MTVDLPEHLADIVRKRALERGYSSAAEYLAELVEADDFETWWATLTPEDQAVHEEFERQLDAAVASGPPIVVDDAWLGAKLRRLRERRAVRAAGHHSS